MPSPVSLAATFTLPQMVDLVRRNWVFLQESFPHRAASLYNHEYIGPEQGDRKNIAEFDTEQFASNKPEGATHQKARFVVGYNKDMIARVFSKELEMTLEFRTFNRYRGVGTRIKKFSQFCPNRKDIDLTHRLTFATSTSYTDMNGETVDITVGDGLALLSTVHTLTGSGTTYSNRVTGDPAFSQSAYEAAMLLGSTSTYDNLGGQRVLNWNTIVTGTDPATVRAVRQMLNSEADVDAIQSGVSNEYRNAEMRHVQLPYLASNNLGNYDGTKRRWWFLIAVGMDGWQAFEGDWILPQFIEPAAGNNGEDVHTVTWTWATYCSYGIAVLSGKGLIGSCPVS